MKRGAFVVLSVLVLAIGVVAAVTIYESNVLSGTVTVTPPALTLSGGGFPSNVTVNGSSYVVFDVASTFSSGSLDVSLYLNVSSPGITNSSLSVRVVTMVNREAVFGPNLTASQVTSSEIGYLLPLGVLGPWSGAEEKLLVTFHVLGAYSWTAEAVGVPVR